MLAQRPKVLYNDDFQNYVMWMYADNYNRSLRMAAVAQSCWVNGPFTFTKNLLPDGNETTDLTVFKNTQGSAFLARTYYENKTYYLPRPIMQPIWQSVQLPPADGEELDPTVSNIDFSMNYHRAFYHHGYDNIDDIYTQRWRKEDIPWLVETGNITETFNFATGRFTLSNSTDDGTSVLSTYLPERRQAELAVHLDNRTYRNIVGQVSN